MRVIVQRVKSSQVTVNGEIVGKIGHGLNLLVGIADTDTNAEVDWMVHKCLELRLFRGEEGAERWQKSIRISRGGFTSIFKLSNKIFVNPPLHS